MKKLYILASLIIGAFAFASCEYADTTPEYKAPTTFVLNTPAAVNGTYNLESSDYVVLTCSQPDYGYTAGVSYEVQVCLSEEFKSEVAKDNPEGNYITLKTKYNAAKLNVKAVELAVALKDLKMLENPDMAEEDFPFMTNAFIRLKARLTSNGMGVIESNVIELLSVKVHLAEIPVTIPEQLYFIGDTGNVRFIRENMKNGLFWRIMWFDAGAEFKFTSEEGNADIAVGPVAEVAETMKVTDNAGAGLAESVENEFVVEKAGWYIVKVKTYVEDNMLFYNVEFAEPKIYLFGSSSIGAAWDYSDANLFEIPTTKDGEFVSPAFEKDTDGDGGVRACVNVGVTWWQSEFIIVAGTIVFREDGADQERVNGTAGQKLYLHFTPGGETEGTGRIE